MSSSSSSTRLLLLSSSSRRWGILATTKAKNTRWFSATTSSSPYTSHEYPWAKEPPIVTRTTAKEAAAAAEKEEEPSTATSTKAAPPTKQQQEEKKPSSWFGNLLSKVSPSSSSLTSTTSSDSSTSSSSSLSSSSSSSSGKSSKLAAAIEAYGDPFDDTGVLSETEVKELKAIMKKALPRTPHKKLEPIGLQPPSYIPPNVPSEQLATPETLVTTLPNGIRVVSQETYSQVSTVGVVTELGSRHETVTGVTNLLELLAFSSTKNYPDSAASSSATHWLGCGAVCQYRSRTVVALHRSVATQRVQGNGIARRSVLQSSCLPMPKLKGPNNPWNWCSRYRKPCHRKCCSMRHCKRPRTGQISNLASRIFVPSCDSQLHRPAAWSHWDSQVLQNPHRMVVGGAGVDHDELVWTHGTCILVICNKMIPSFDPSVPSEYRGGSHSQHCRGHGAWPPGSPLVYTGHVGIGKRFSIDTRGGRTGSRGVAFVTISWPRVFCKRCWVAVRRSVPVVPARACTRDCTDAFSIPWPTSNRPNRLPIFMPNRDCGASPDPSHRTRHGHWCRLFVSTWPCCRCNQSMSKNWFGLATC